MPTIREYKVALKGASMAFMAGAHAVTDAVWQYKSANLSGEKRMNMCVDLELDLKKALKDPGAAEDLTNFLNEEGLYPFGEAWSTESIAILIDRLKTPKINTEDPFDGNTEFKFKKGFHKVLLAVARKRFAATDEDAEIAMSQLDHWLSLILSGAFHFGATTMARSARESASFRSALAGLEQEAEPWARYAQIGNLYDAEMARDEGPGDDADDVKRERGRDDGFGFDDDDDDDDNDNDQERIGFGFDDEYGDD